MTRKPVVSGVFYPSGKEMLRRTIEDSFLGPLGPGEIPAINENRFEKPYGLISPHAGYMYSGQVAAWGFSEIAKLGTPDLVILMGPNHTGYGPPISVYPSGNWETPLGGVEVDEEAVQIILENSSLAKSDTSAHSMEHSLEVQLPFLQYLYGNSFKIVPITMLDQSPNSSSDLSKALLRLISLKPTTLVIASTDLNHYDDHESTLKKDSLIIEAIENNDPRMLYSAVYEAGVTMCGYGAVATLMLMEVGKPKVLKHATSGEVSGDFLEVVGYLSAAYI